MPKPEERHKNPTSASGCVDVARVYGWPAAILLNKLEYLSRYTTREDGFCFHTAQQLQDELALGEWELRSAVKKLEDAEIIETKNTYKVGTTTKCRHFRVLRDASRDYLDPERFLNKSKIHKSDSEKTSKSEVEKTSKSIDSEKTSKSVYSNNINNNKNNNDLLVKSSGSTSTQDSESSQNSQEYKTLPSLEASKQTSEQSEQPRTSETSEADSGLDAHAASVLAADGTLRWPVARRIIKDSFFRHTGKKPMMPRDLEERYNEVCENIGQPLTLKVLEATLNTYFDTKWIDSPSVRGFLSPKVWDYVGTEEYVTKIE